MESETLQEKRLAEAVKVQRTGSSTAAKRLHTSRQHSISANFNEIIENDGPVAVKSEEIDDAKRPQTKVLLIAAHRSGSTFLGELFNQNENAFYLFEPLVAIQSKMSTMGCDENTEGKIR